MKNRTLLFSLIGILALGILISFSAVAGGVLSYLIFVDQNRVAFAADQPEVNPDKGILVSNVNEGSLADQAGLVRGDILQELNGKEINNLQDFHTIVTKMEDDDNTNITVLHGDEIKILKFDWSEESNETGFGISTCPDRFSGRILPFNLEKDLPESLFREFSLNGAVITEVVEESPADSAGIIVGDVILAVENEKVYPGNDLADVISGYKPGDEVILKIKRADDAETTINVTLSEHPDDEEKAYLGIRYRYATDRFFKQPQNPEDMDDIPFRELPFRPAPFEYPEGIESGIVIVEVIEKSPAADAGLESGDLILEIEDDSITALKDLFEALEGKSPGDKVSLTVYTQTDGEENQISVVLAEHPDNPEQGFIGIIPAPINPPHLPFNPHFDDESGDFYFFHDGDDGSFQFEFPFDMPFEFPFDTDKESESTGDNV